MDALPHYTSRQKIIDAQDLDKPHPAQIKLSYKWPFQRNRLLVQLAAKRSDATSSAVTGRASLPHDARIYVSTWAICTSFKTPVKDSTKRARGKYHRRAAGTG